MRDGNLPSPRCSAFHALIIIPLQDLRALIITSRQATLVATLLVATLLVLDHMVGVVGVVLLGLLLREAKALVDLLMGPAHALAVLPLAAMDHIAAMDQFPLVVVQMIAKPRLVVLLMSPSQPLPTTRLGTHTVMSAHPAALNPVRKYT